MESQIDDKDFKIFLKHISYLLIGALLIFPAAYILYLLSIPATIAKGYLNSVGQNYFLIIVCGLTVSSLFLYISSINKHAFSENKKNNIYLFLKICIVIYGIYLFLYSVGRYNSFASEAIDFPYFHYAILQLSHFQLPMIWDMPGRYVWADHFSPILILFVPFYWLLPNPALLMALQVLIVLSGAIPLYLSSKHVLHSKFLSLSLVIGYITFGGLQMGYAYGFHEIILFPTFFFWVYYFFVKKKIWWYVVFIILTLCIKEESAFIITFLGLYLLVLKKNKTYAFVTMCLGAIWYVLTFYFIIPFFNKGNAFGYWGQYSGGDSGIFGLMQSAILHPLTFLHSLITPAYKIDTMFHTFAPFAFLFPPSILIFLPSLMEKLMSSTLAGYNGYHYSAAIVGVVIIAVIETVRHISKQSFWKKLIPNQQAFWGIVIMYCSISSNILFGYYPLSPFFISVESSQNLSDVEVSTLQKTIDSLPQNATIAAHAVIIPHIIRPMGMVRHGPSANENAEFIIWDEKLSDYFISKDVSKIFQDLITSGKYKVIVQENSVVLLQRVK